MYHAKIKQYLPTLFLMIICVGLFSCSKKCGCLPPQDGRGFAGTMKKGTTLPWEESNFADTIKNDTATIFVTKTNYNFAIKLKFGLDNKTSKLINNAYYRPVDATFYYYGYTPGGVLIYKLDNTANNTFFTYSQIGDNRFNEGGWVKPFFNLTFIVATPTGNIVTDTTRVYFSGRFAIKLDK